METTTYAPDTVGAFMDPHYLSFEQNRSVKEAIDMIRFLSNGGVPIIYAYAVDEQYRLVGVLVMRDLLVSPDDALIRDIMRTSVYSINVNRKRQEVVQEALERKYLAAPIVDDDNHLLGAIKFGDIVSYAQEESSRDIQTMFGAGAEETAISGIGTKIKTRLPWLQVNLATAFAAAAIIGVFEDIVAKVTALAIFLPIIAGQGGNTGAQSLAVVMRGLALDQIPAGLAKKIVWNEVAAGAFNGIAVGLVTGVIAWVWQGNYFLGLIIGVSMILNMAVATLFGALIPLGMRKCGLDPAQCSSIILTTVTDVCGFFILLALAVTFQSYIL